MARGNAFRAREAAQGPGPRNGRMRAILVLMGLAYAGVCVRAWHLQMTRHAEFIGRSEDQHNAEIKLRARRGDIVDRKGNELAKTTMVKSVSAVPSAVTDPTATALALGRVLGVDVDQVGRRLARGNQFAWIKRHVTDEEAKQVEALKLPGIELADEPQRFYPNRDIAGSLLGFANVDGDGLEGIERDFDEFLKGKEYEIGALRDARGHKLFTGGYLPAEHLAGARLELTLDLRIQQIAQDAIVKQVHDMEAHDGLVVVMDPQTGDILAMAQTPSFDPNLYGQATPDAWRNRAITDVIEPGSTMKPFLISGAIDAGKVTADETWDTFGGKLKIGRKIVRDVHAEGRLTTLQIIQKSSNVGAAQVAQRLGKELYYQYLRAFGFGEETGVGLKGEVPGILHPVEKWGLIHLVTIGYGYGIGVTPMQMIRGMSAIANGGRLMEPRLVRRIVDNAGHVVEDFPPRIVRRVVGQQAIADVTRALEMVVSDEGTAVKAMVPGFRVAGKTGTAHMLGPGGYAANRYRASFIGFVPVQAPRLVIYVVVNDPAKAKYGGLVAAPVFSSIARQVLPYLGVEATEPIVTTAHGADATASAAEEEADEIEVIDPQAKPWWMQSSLGGEVQQQILVPDFHGKPLAEVVAQAGKLGIELDVEGDGLVTAQEPKAGATMSPEGRLSVTLSLPGEPPSVAEARP